MEAKFCCMLPSAVDLVIMSISNLFLTEIMLLKGGQINDTWSCIKRIKTSLPLDPVCKMSFKQWETCRKELWFTGDFKGKLCTISASCCGALKHSCSFLFSSHFSLPPSFPVFPFTWKLQGDHVYVWQAQAELWCGCLRQGQAPVSAASPVPAFTLGKYTPALGGGEINNLFSSCSLHFTVALLTLAASKALFREMNWWWSQFSFDQEKLVWSYLTTHKIGDFFYLCLAKNDANWSKTCSYMWCQYWGHNLLSSTGAGAPPARTRAAKATKQTWKPLLVLNTSKERLEAMIECALSVQIRNTSLYLP